MGNRAWQFWKNRELKKPEYWLDKVVDGYGMTIYRGKLIIAVDPEDYQITNAPQGLQWWNIPTPEATQERKEALDG